jgi:hypothetical protein
MEVGQGARMEKIRNTYKVLAGKRAEERHV